MTEETPSSDETPVSDDHAGDTAAGPGFRATLAQARTWVARQRHDHAAGVRVALTLLCCYLTGLLVVNLGSTGWGSVVVGHIFPRVAPSGALNTQALDTMWGDIQRDYVVRDVAGSLGTQGSEQGIVDLLKQQYHDRFTTLFTPSEAAQFSADLAGQRSGSIGIAIEERCSGETICPQGQTPTEIVIEEVLRNQPADRAGLRNGDVLIAVNGTSVTSLGSSVDDQVNALTDRSLIRGPAGTPVSLTVRRGQSTLTITVTRADLQIPSVYSERIGSILYMQVTGFATDTGDVARQQLQQNLAGATAVVLDLRHNGGGYVSAAQTLASQFLAPGGRVQNVVLRRGRLTAGGQADSGTVEQDDPVQAGGVATGIKVVVLVDANTASAAEIVASALHDYGRATLVGEKTFGKGSVQVDYPLPDGNVLHLTVERWYGPNGESIDGAGITPDDQVLLPSPDSRFTLDSQSVPEQQDPQLERALALAGG